MQTVGRRMPKHRRGQKTAHCSYCGVRWYSGDLRRDASGKWACPDDIKGRDTATLDAMNAEGAASYRPGAADDGVSAPYFVVDIDSPTPQRTTRDDI